MTGKIEWSRKLGEDGEWILDPIYILDGESVSQAVFDAAFPDRDISCGQVGGHHPSCWPLMSEAAAVHPKQIAEAIESAKKKGVPTEFNRMGQPIFTSRGHRRDYLKAYQMHDRNGGFGDG